MDWPVVLVVVLALGFAWTNGFHDAANAIATSVSTRALTPRIAVALAAVMNFVGAFAGIRVARTVASGLVTMPVPRSVGLAVTAAALVGAIAWNLLTWWRGLPSSSSHALVGGLVGAALVAGVAVQWPGLVSLVLLPTLVSPLVGLAAGALLMTGLTWVFRHSRPARLASEFRTAQTVSAAAVAFGHGMQDATKTAGVVMLALLAGGVQPAGADGIPLWVIALSSVVMALGTYAGGWRIVRTLGRRIVRLTPAQGFAAEASAAVVLYATTASGAPISTTHVITSAIIGSGSGGRATRVRWRVVAQILLAWLLTFPGAGLVAALVYLALSPLT